MREESGVNKRRRSNEVASYTESRVQQSQNVRCFDSLDVDIGIKCSILSWRRLLDFRSSLQPFPPKFRSNPRLAISEFHILWFGLLPSCSLLFLFFGFCDYPRSTFAVCDSQRGSSCSKGRSEKMDGIRNLEIDHPFSIFLCSYLLCRRGLLVVKRLL